jgi:surfeit locus 1 family protein
MTLIRLRLAPTLSTIPVVLICVALGLWQLERLQWKRGLIAQRETAVAAAPVSSPQTIAEARALEFHSVTVDGVFLNDKELYLNATGPRGGAGFHVLTPLREETGRTVLVNRGFVPSERRGPATRPQGQPAGTLHIRGLLRLAPEQKPSWFIPDNRPDIDYWFWIDLPAMAAANHLDPTNVAPFYIDADATPNPGGWPQGGTTPLALPNNHLQYAITWFSLAAAALVIYVVYHWRARDPHDGGVA